METNGAVFSLTVIKAPSWVQEYPDKLQIERFLHLIPGSVAISAFFPDNHFRLTLRMLRVATDMHPLTYKKLCMIPETRVLLQNYPSGVFPYNGGEQRRHFACIRVRFLKNLNLTS